ncbi:bifunctional phosphopantothenoylcysteine decarboxylase/phosphopantothenate--cysteine ligase CoaBC [Corynebacterium sp. MSK032]|uniref:bifunctional phosphopantothenoylcysteine decarboxylase/phosphopantothenate--cysteine ligase CoaBC n=1 Tax=Corynebacterium sp. MSK032 TaxID=3050191 RepID=UPI00254B2A43|nr:bifunctional phosphopantothenoylcysteine decarboxylase/phosphopantothenate--cysteine ligase CoaBC [Corynebacterium sp. MSK032]MDK8793473.1 bifunctional phosphopantothenoylcysteine decarboxylase/phosphopantothenate--cysteine ligase CoaBC [Corynebacterium sp. MSK032]
MHAAGNADVSECLKVVVGVAGGIAAYKAAHVVRGFKELGHDVRVVPTESALNFVGAATFEALSGNPVSTTVFDAVDEVQHVRVGQEADLVVVVPATADFMARAAHGRADDLLTATLLVATCPVVLAPAMHTEMWNHPATRDNVAILRRHGTIVLDPAHGRLTGKDTGPGRLPEPEQIVSLALAAVENPRHFRRDFEGVRFMITAGGTREAIDPVRFIGNHSSGRQGFALAEMAAQRGAQVTVVAGHTDQLPTPLGANVVKVDSTLEMAKAAHEHSKLADVCIFAAAVADFRPASTAGAKMKKGVADDALSNIQLVENPDILATTVERRKAGEIPATTTMVGFAAETGDETTTPLELAKQKIVRKGCDLLMCNDVSGGQTFGATDNVGWLLSLDGEQWDVPRGSKFSVAGSILDTVSELRQEPQPAE